MKRKFAIEVNQRRYEVYPQLETMLEKESVDERTRQVISKAMEGRSMPIARRVIIKQYLEKVLQNLSSKEGQPISKDQIN